MWHVACGGFVLLCCVKSEKREVNKNVGLAGKHIGHTKKIMISS